MWQLISRVNKYIVENEPWAIAGKPAEQKKLDSVLFHSAESLRLIAALAAPVIPKTALALWEQLGLEGEVADIRLNELRWNGELAGKTIRAGGFYSRGSMQKRCSRRWMRSAGGRPALKRRRRRRQRFQRLRRWPLQLRS